MLIRIGNKAYVSSSAGEPDRGLRLVSANGSERHAETGGRKGALLAEPDATLVLRHASRVSIT